MRFEQILLIGIGITFDTGLAISFFGVSPGLLGISTVFFLAKE
jgi:hypothetical protein